MFLQKSLFSLLCVIFGGGSPLKTLITVLVWTFFPFTIVIASAKALLVASSSDCPIPVTTTFLNLISENAGKKNNKLNKKIFKFI